MNISLPLNTSLFISGFDDTESFTIPCRPQHSFQLSLSWSVLLFISSLKLSLEHTSWFRLLPQRDSTVLHQKISSFFFHEMLFEAVINARNSNMLHSVLFRTP